MCNFGQAEYVQARLAIIINPRAAITKFVDSKRGKDLFFLYVVVKIGHKRSREGGRRAAQKLRQFRGKKEKGANPAKL